MGEVQRLKLLFTGNPDLQRTREVPLLQSFVFGLDTDS